MSYLAKSRTRALDRIRTPPATKAASILPQLDTASSLISSQGQRNSQVQRRAYSLLNHWVWVAIDTISKRLAGQMICAGELEDATANPERSRGPTIKKDMLPSRIRQKAAKQDVEVIASHPALDALARPNHVQKKFEFLYMSTANLLATGESYWLGGMVKGDDGEEKLEMWSPPTTHIVPQHNGGLFTGYLYRPPGASIGVPIPPEMIARTYIADPADLRSSMSPLRAILTAAQVDHHIQSSQLTMFERGIDPNLIITVGKAQGPDGRNLDHRPRLTGRHRQQFIRAIRQLWARTVNEGDPAIVDGLIESVHKLQAMPREMDWGQSGEQVKARIFQAFGVNPIVVGEIVGSNRAQATEAQKNFCDQSVNPLIDCFSETYTDFVGPMYEDPARLLLWIDPCKPVDQEIELKKWDTGLKFNAASTNEYRTNVLGLEANEEQEERNPLLNTVGGIQAVSGLLTQVGQGLIAEEQAAKVLELFLEIDEATAESLVDRGDEPEPLPVPPQQQLPPPEDDEDTEEQDESDDSDDEKKKANTSWIGEDAALLLHEAVLTKSASPGVTLTRKSISEASRRQSVALEKYVGQAFIQPFAESVKRAASKLRSKTVKLDPDKAEKQAAQLAKAIFDIPKAQDELDAAAFETFPTAFAIGALTERELTKAVLLRTKTTAEDVAERLREDFGIDAEEDVSDVMGISAGPLPEWMLEAAEEELNITFAQDYWTRIVETTRDDIAFVLRDGIEDGLSIRKMAQRISEMAGSDYPITRATAVARTESSNQSNAGHSAGISQLEAETGLRIGKEWLSVLGNTTRITHADMDGVSTASADGLFTLGGVEIPWPAHHSLPAGERVNCQCTIISKIISDGAGKE